MPKNLSYLSYFAENFFERFAKNKPNAESERLIIKNKVLESPVFGEVALTVASELEERLSLSPASKLEF